MESTLAWAIPFQPSIKPVKLSKGQSKDETKTQHDWDLSSRDFNDATLAAAFAQFQLDWPEAEQLTDQGGSNSDKASEKTGNSEVPMSENLPAESPVNPPANPTVDQSPADRLKALRDQLRSQDDELGSKTKARDALKADVESLAKTVDEIEKAGAAYAKSLDALKEDRKKIDDYQKTKTQMIDGVLGEEKKKSINDKITEVKQNITKEADDVKKADDDAKTAASESQSAQKALADKQSEYDRFKSIQQDLADKIQKCKDFRTKIEQFDDQNKPASMYVYLEEMKSVLAGTTVLTLEEFKTQLNARWQELDDAKEDSRNKKLDSQAATEKLSREQGQLEAAEKYRVADILTKVDPFNA